jgi:hypothetical protein
MSLRPNIGKSAWKRHAAKVARNKAEQYVDPCPTHANGHPFDCDCDECQTFLRSQEGN